MHQHVRGIPTACCSLALSISSRHPLPSCPTRELRQHPPVQTRYYAINTNIHGPFQTHYHFHRCIQRGSFCFCWETIKRGRGKNKPQSMRRHLVPLAMRLTHHSQKHLLHLHMLTALFPVTRLRQIQYGPRALGHCELPILLLSIFKKKDPPNGYLLQAERTNTDNCVGYRDPTAPTRW